MPPFGDEDDHTQMTPTKKGVLPCTPSSMSMEMQRPVHLVDQCMVVIAYAYGTVRFRTVYLWYFMTHSVRYGKNTVFSFSFSSLFF